MKWHIISLKYQKVFLCGWPLFQLFVSQTQSSVLFSYLYILDKFLKTMNNQFLGSILGVFTNKTGY